MRKIVFSLLCAGGITAFGSTITLPSTQDPGIPGTVTVSAFVANGNSMAGMQILAVFSDGLPAVSCTWASSAGSTAGCSSLGNFSIGFPTAITSTSPEPGGGGPGAIWTITDLRGAGAGNDLVSLTIVGTPPVSGSGVGFDRCLVFNGTTNVIADGNHGGTTCQNTSDSRTGTTGSEFGYSVGSAPGGTGSATVEYVNELHLAATPPVGDLWGEVILSFGSTLNGSDGTKNAFTFKADTDLLTTFVSDTPEPATSALIGIGLISLVLLGRKRKNA